MPSLLARILAEKARRETKSFPLFKLPRELRDIVYLHSLATSALPLEVVDRYEVQPSVLGRGPTLDPTALAIVQHAPLGLLLANRQANFETSEAAKEHIFLSLRYEDLWTRDGKPMMDITLFATPVPIDWTRLQVHRIPLQNIHCLYMEFQMHQQPQSESCHICYTESALTMYPEIAHLDQAIDLLPCLKYLVLEVESPLHRLEQQIEPHTVKDPSDFFLEPCLTMRSDLKIEQQLIVVDEPWHLFRRDAATDEWQNMHGKNWIPWADKKSNRRARFRAWPSHSKYARHGFEFEVLDPGFSFEEAMRIEHFELGLLEGGSAWRPADQSIGHDGSAEGHEFVFNNI